MGLPRRQPDEFGLLGMLGRLGPALAAGRFRNKHAAWTFFGHSGSESMVAFPLSLCSTPSRVQLKQTPFVLP